MTRPDYADDQQQRLAEIGVLLKQVERLRHVLIEVKRVSQAPTGTM